MHGLERSLVSDAPTPRALPCALLVALGLPGPACAAEGAGAWKPRLSAAVSERFDSNIMLQNEGALARIESWVTSVQPVIGAAGPVTANSPLNLDFRYAPDFTFFHERDEESYLRHTGRAEARYQQAPLLATARLRGQYTDGSTEGPVWGTPDTPGSIPALGAAEVRYRRRNLLANAGFDLRYDFERSFCRGVFDGRWWDIMTDFKSTPGYTQQNYVDRSDVNGGLDAGLHWAGGWEVAAGWRYGHQYQQQLPEGSPYTYDNDYQRIVGSLGASPWRWFRFSGEAGPSLHRFDPDHIPAGEDVDETLLYGQGRLSFTPVRDTSLSASASENLLPSTSGRSAFQNLRVAAALDQRITRSLRGSLRFELQEYDFVRGQPYRDDVYQFETRLECAVNPHLSLAAWFMVEWAENFDPGVPGREYDRQVVGLAVTAKR